MTAVICKIDFRLPAVHSLKEKRRILKKLMSRAQSQFSVFVAEVGYHDLLQRTELGVSFVGSDSTILNSLADKLLLYLDELALGEVLNSEREIVHM